VENTASTVAVRRKRKRMDNIRDAAMNFEAVKVSMSQDRNGMIASSGLLCRNAEFGKYMNDVGYIDEHDPVNLERAVTQAVREHCNIQSRSEFRDSPEARKKFEQLREDFKQWKKS